MLLTWHFWTVLLYMCVHPDHRAEWTSLVCNIWFLEWYFCEIYKKLGIWNFISIRWTKNKANSFHCLDITFIQDINFQYLAGPLCWIHSSSYMLKHWGKLIQIWCWCALPTLYELILIIVRSKVFNGKGWSIWSYG